MTSALLLAGFPLRMRSLQREARAAVNHPSLGDYVQYPGCALSGAGGGVCLDRLVCMPACRFFIKHAFRKAKGALVMADCQFATEMPGTDT